ncbi:MAG: HAD hydrolase-like protein [Deltaproteobacteria bacterium]|nr:HAD hydrolase-like protein [Deltaproteobacteria bacterium]
MATDVEIREVAREVLLRLAIDKTPHVETPRTAKGDELLVRGSCGIDLVVFDLAGTTIRDDDATVLECFLGAAREANIRADRGEMNAWMGAAKKQVFQHFSRRMGGDEATIEERAAKGYAAFQRNLEERYRTGPVEPLPGVERCFERLKACGIRVAASTGFYRRVVDILFSRLGWDRGIIDACVTSDEVPRGRPAPFMIFSAMTKLGIESVARVAKVGDTPFDLHEGRNAGVGLNVGVLSGSHDALSLGREAHAFLLASAAELPELLNREHLLPR